jgi:ribonuclease D
MVKQLSITTQPDLDQFCQDLGDSPWVAFDTEFVSEDRYRPELCLLQVATPDVIAVVDPLTVTSTQPFWDHIAKTSQTVIVHAGREEIRFAYRFTEQPIANLFDVQLAAGLVGMDYPASYANLIHHYLGKTLDKGETRTDWRRRPLSEHQIEYAMQDVADLGRLHEVMLRKLNKLKRLQWLREEVENLQQAVMEAEIQESWRRVSGGSTLPPRQAAVLRELWRWREQQAKQADVPARRVLRDDLLVELARRGTDDVRRIRSLRGMERRNLASQYEEMSQAIRRAMSMEEEQLPSRGHGQRRIQAPLLTQFLGTAVACVSRQQRIAPSIVGNSDDIRDLLSYELAGRKGMPLPSLLQGWRADVIGRSFQDLLSGRLAMRIASIHDDQPLELFELEDED